MNGRAWQPDSAASGPPSVEEIARTIASALSPQRIVLFGSRAEGRSGVESDVDLLIVMESTLSPAERVRLVSSLFPRRRWSLDAVVVTPGELAEARRCGGSVIAQWDRTGRVLYAA